VGAIGGEPFGHVVSCLGWGRHALASVSFKNATYSGVFTLVPLLTSEGRAHHGDILAQATRLVEAGQLVPLVDPASLLPRFRESAYTALRDCDAQGKIIVDLAAAAQGEMFLDALEGAWPAGDAASGAAAVRCSSPGKHLDPCSRCEVLPPSCSRRASERYWKLKTRITEQYGLKVPFINAGIAFIATAPLVRAVCSAGGMGMLGSAATPPRCASSGHPRY
jgi:hypothetical protein